MSELSKYLVEQILLEDDNPIKKTVVVYVGRFQPFHKGHYATYQHLVKKFGKDNVFIGTSNKVEKPKSPFNFREKVKIMTTMFGIPSSKIYQVKNPYAPTEILSKFDEKSTAFITVVGEKDSSRLSGKYFTSLKGTPTEGYKDRGYVYISPAQPNAISGTDVRNGLSLGSDDQKQSFFIDRAYGKFNKTIFNLLKDKLNEGVVEIKKERIEDWLVSESTAIIPGGSDVDDGPNFFFPNYDVFSKISTERATKIGWEIVNMITSKELEDYYDHPNYPNGPTKAVTFFPAGVIGSKTPNNQVDIYSSGAYTQWYKHATRKASLVGYELVSDPRMKDDKKQSGDSAKGDKELKDEFEKSINEVIELPVEIGDTLLMGKFKNKKVVVKSIGKDEHGMPTINGKKVVTFRLMKEGKQVFFEDEREDKRYTSVGFGNFKLKGKEKDPKSPTFKRDDSGKYIELDKDGNEKSQSNQGTAMKTKDMQDRVAKEDEVRKRMNGDSDSKSKESTDWTDGKDGWEILDDKRSKVTKLRKYSDEEYKGETGEYFGNDVTMKVAPKAFKDEADMIQKMKNAKPVFLSSEEMQNMGNTDVGDILDTSEKGGKESMIKLGKERAEEYGKDWDRLEKGIQSDAPVPAPMALRDKNGDLHLLAGNTRLMSFTAFGKKLPVKVIDYDGEFQYNESINEIAGTAIKCEKCNHSWEIESDDKEKYLCHSCGWDSQQQEYDYDAFDSWQEKNGILDEALSQSQRAARRWAFAKNRKLINIKKQRTAIRKKPYAILYKRAYKLAYLQVRKEWTQRLFGSTPYDELSIPNKQRVSQMVQRKKRKIIKLARFKFFPYLKQKEADRFGNDDIKQNVSFTKPTQKNEMSMSQLKGIEKYAEKQLSPEDIEFTKHFFDRVNDPRNGKEISDAELTGFFKRLSKHKKQFKDFLEKYKQIVVKDKRYDINIPFVKSANQIIAKTVMRKDDFKTSSPTFAFEDKIPGGLSQGMTLKDIAKKHNVQLSDLLDEFKKGYKVEREHTTDTDIAKEIAMDHLFEDPKYYTKLQSIEETIKKVGDEWIVYPKDGGKRLGTHKTYKSALRQLHAIEMSKHEEIDELLMGYPDQEWMDNHEKELHKLRKDFDKEVSPKSNDKYQYGVVKKNVSEGIEDTLSTKYKVDLDIYEYPNHLELRRIVVPQDQRGKGIGSKVMQDLIKYAKSNNKDIFTTPSSDFGGSKSRLIQFYKSFGFKDNKGSNRDFRSKESMVRLSENILSEGGAYGHMNHPFDTEINLTFGQLKDIVNRALEGDLELTREKTDGQALAISWVNGRLVAARNKGHLKNRGENALDIKGVADKFAGRGELEKAYNFAMKDLSDSIKSLSEKQREKIFKNGACFMNLEVIYPTSVNVIPYGQPLLVFHGTMEYDMSGVAIGENQDSAKILAGMIKQVNKDVQDNYTIQGPPVVSLPKNQHLSSQKGKFTSQISKLQKEFGLKDTDGVAEYHQEWWKRWIGKNSPSTLDNKTLMGLVKRWAFFDKGFRIDKNSISDEKTLTWAQKIDKEDQSKISKQNLMKFEDIFLGVGAEVLQFTSSVLTVNPDEATRAIKKRIDQTIKDVKKSGDPKKIEKLKLELKRLQAIGGPDKIVPNEGIVFVYNGNTFKLTGAFASVNQLLGIFF